MITIDLLNKTILIKILLVIKITIMVNHQLHLTNLPSFASLCQLPEPPPTSLANPSKLSPERPLA